MGILMTVEDYYSEEEEYYSEYEYAEADGNDDEEDKLGSDNDEQEASNEYEKNGYCPIEVGDFFHDRYQIIRKLGWGAFSTVWLAWDNKRKMFSALKVMKSKKSYYETAKDEVDLLECIREADSHEARRSVTTLLNYFTVDSIFGTHFVMVFGVLGPNLYKFLQKSQYQGIPIPVVK